MQMKISTEAQEISDCSAFRNRQNSNVSWLTVMYWLNPQNIWLWAEWLGITTQWQCWNLSPCNHTQNRLQINQAFKPVGPAGSFPGTEHLEVW